MSNTPNLGIVLLSENVLQKEVLINEGLIAFDALIARIVKNLTSTPPGSPADGDMYIVGNSPTGVWAGQAKKLAFFYNGWHFITPPLKMQVYDQTLVGWRSYEGNVTGWVAVAASTISVLDDIGDVNVTGVTNGQFLRYNGTEWVASTYAVTGNLDDINDVNAPTPADGQFLRYRTATSEWKAETYAPTIPTSLAGLSDVSMTGAATGYIFQWNASTGKASFVNYSPSVVALNDIGDVVATSPATNDVLTWNGSTWAPSSVALTMGITGLTNGPGSMVGNSLKFIRVNYLETNWEYVDLGTAIAAATAPYDIGGFGLDGGYPLANEVLGRFIAPRSFFIPAGATGSVGKADVAATASSTFTFKKNGTAVGTATFAAAGTSATFTFASQINFVAGDVLTMTAPASVDSTLKDFSFTLKCTRTN